MSTSISELVAGAFVLTEVTVRSRSFVKKDKAVTDQAIANNHASADAGSFHKNLFASASGELRALKKAGAAARTYLYNKTTPYDTGQGSLQKGARLLPATQSLDFIQGFGELEATYMTALDGFKQVYDQRKQQALAALGAMGDSSEYPEVYELDEYFGIELSMNPVPTSAQLPDSLPIEVMEQAAKDMAQTQMDSLSNAIADTRDRLGDELARMAGVLKRHSEGEKTKLYGSLLDNMRNVTDLLDATNITNDPALDLVVQRVRAELCPPKRTIDDYKMSRGLAEDAARAAGQISAELTSAPSVGGFTVSTPPELPELNPEDMGGFLLPVGEPTPALDELQDILGVDSLDELEPEEPEVPKQGHIPVSNPVLPEGATTEIILPDFEDMF